jgi:hypothetical protein
MPEHKNDPRILIRVKDKAGNDFLCPLEELRDPAHVTESELRYCFDSAQEAFTDEEVMAIIKNDLRKNFRKEDE